MRSGEVIWTVFTSFEIEGYYQESWPWKWWLRLWSLTALPKVSFLIFSISCCLFVEGWQAIANVLPYFSVRQDKTGSIQQAHILQHHQIIPWLYMAWNFGYLSPRIKQRATQQIYADEATWHLQENLLRLIINNYNRFPLSFYDTTIRLKHRGRFLMWKEQFYYSAKMCFGKSCFLSSESCIIQESACSTLKASKSINTCSSTSHSKQENSILVRYFCGMLLRRNLGLLWRTIAEVTLNCRFKMPS